MAYTNPQKPTPAVSFTWDSAYPRIDAMTDGTGKTKFAYVAAGDNGALQLSGETGPAGAPSKYAYNYDELGRIEQLNPVKDARFARAALRRWPSAILDGFAASRGSGFGWGAETASVDRTRKQNYPLNYSS